jgi:hypothetical protein
MKSGLLDPFRKVAGSMPDGVIGFFFFLGTCSGPGFDSVSKRHEYPEYFLGSKGGRCVGPTTLPPSSADFHETWEPQPSGTLL